MPRARSVLAVTRMVRIGAEVTQQSDINAIEGANAYERGIEMGIGVRGVLRHIFTRRLEDYGGHLQL